ncbi:alpha/beta fold hydrolase [Campylobacter geochelonis]|uniref:alpha/beta fold hydrolase n=1 Tax=Campylobacter geochelonis TaxID=1780362 RepID=UPI0007709BEC|nr:alpha/beta hydrolase [Campylobacter geochelonis]CZE48049.1 alpha/beta hydrolase fold [Campylobacter geochelonis]CZE51062.1 alpha/beta hydrolase fold [Campylobacter geochelonis]
MATKEIKYQGKIYKISYDVKNNEAKEYILVLHGWGANKEIMLKAFGNNFKKIKQIYIDLPGFGSSSIHGALNTKDYTKITAEFIKAIGSDPLIIMGHSYGGKVATLLKPRNLVLLSTAGIVEPKPLMVRFKIAIYKILKLFGLGKLYSLFASKDVSGMSRVMYETLKNVVNEDFRDIFKSSKSNALIFWGEDDTATKLKSGELIHKLIDKSEFYPLKGDHFFFLLHAKFIASTIEEKLLSEECKRDEKKQCLDEICAIGDVCEREHSFKDEKTAQDDMLKVQVQDIKENDIKDLAKSLDESISKALDEAEMPVSHSQKYKNLDEVCVVGEVYEKEHTLDEKAKDGFENKDFSDEIANLSQEKSQNLASADIKDKFDEIKAQVGVKNNVLKQDSKECLSQINDEENLAKEARNLAQDKVFELEIPKLLDIKDEFNDIKNLEENADLTQDKNLENESKESNLNEKNSKKSEKKARKFSEIYKMRVKKATQKDKNIGEK